MSNLTGHELFHAIITKAVDDASKETKDAKEARQWLLEDNDSFYYICEGAGIENVEEFRQRLKEKLNGNTL
jgi:hypothetical protein